MENKAFYQMIPSYRWNIMPMYFHSRRVGNIFVKSAVYHILHFTTRKGKLGAFQKRFKKQSDDVFGQSKAEFRKRDFFFAPASPYQQMETPVDRRMFLVHRGERGPCFFRACHHGGMCIPRRHGFYCECLPGFIGTRCEVKKECRPSTCKNGGTCTEIAVGRHLCTCLVGFLGENCESRSPCHPNPCRNEGTCSQTDDSYTCVCEQGYKGKNCETNKCSPNPCKNAGVCFEELNDYVCNCPQGFKGRTCEVVSECNSVYCLNGGTCRDEPSGYNCDCRFRSFLEKDVKCKQGFTGHRCRGMKTLQFYFIIYGLKLEDHVHSASALMEGPVWMEITPTVNMDLHVYVREDLTALCARNIFLITWKTLSQLHELHMIDKVEV
ncbi:uncharacterized protein LOC144665730 isoform X2 [Oculina patagonica]